MKSAILAALVAAFLCLGCATKQGPTMVLRQGADTLTLTADSCGRKVIEMLKPEVRERFKAARAVVDGQSFEACWTLHDEVSVFVVYDDGDTNLIPIGLFVKAADKPKTERQAEDWRKSA